MSIILNKLQAHFHIIEMAFFPEWQKADAKRREEIEKLVGETEAIMIIDEAQKEAKKQIHE